MQNQQFGFFVSELGKYSKDPPNHVSTLTLSTKLSIIKQNEVFWVVTPCSFVVGYQTFQRSMLSPASLHPEDGGSMDFWNVGILPRNYTASRPRRPRLESSLPRKLQNSSVILHSCPTQYYFIALHFSVSDKIIKIEIELNVVLISTKDLIQINITTRTVKFYLQLVKVSFLM
jgi:hypothetical protein